MSSRRGFTIVETSLAVVFLSILLMSILTLTLTAGKLYIKGSTNRSINQSGRDIATTLRQDFLDTGMGAIIPITTATRMSDTALSGRVCLGSVVYLWNTADLINAATTGTGATGALADSVVMQGDTKTPIKLVRISNPQQSYCTKDANGNYPMTIPVNESATELLGGNGRDYAVYKIAMAPVASNGNTGIYRLTYTIGTNEPGTTQTAASGYTQCTPEGSSTADFNYCSVNDFDMMVRVGGSQQ